MLNSYSLKRIPQDPKLQAWNSADELLLSRLSPDAITNLLLVNDSFGALAVVYKKVKTSWWNDSAMSLEALLANTEANDSTVPTFFSPKESTEHFSHVVIQLPKSTRLFHWQLSIIAKHLNEDSKVFILAMAKHVSTRHIELMNEFFEIVDPGKAIKKARVIQASNIRVEHPKIDWTTYVVPELNTTLSNAPGCFAENSIDLGARAFIGIFESLPKAKRILDLGCGNGILSLAISQQNPDADIYLADESAQAIASARLNLSSRKGKFHFHHSNGCNNLDDEITFNLIICNPPFHQQSTLTESIAYKLFDDAKARVEESGEVWIVANRHLNYFHHLKARFKTVETTAVNSKFNVYRCLLPI